MFRPLHSARKDHRTVEGTLYNDVLAITVTPTAQHTVEVVAYCSFAGEPQDKSEADANTYTLRQPSSSYEEIDEIYRVIFPAPIGGSHTSDITHQQYVFYGQPLPRFSLDETYRAALENFVHWAFAALTELINSGEQECQENPPENMGPHKLAQHKPMADAFTSDASCINIHQDRPLRYFTNGWEASYSFDSWLKNSSYTETLINRILDDPNKNIYRCTGDNTTIYFSSGWALVVDEKKHRVLSMKQELPAELQESQPALPGQKTKKSSSFPTEYSDVSSYLLKRGFIIQLGRKHPKVTHSRKPGVSVAFSSTASDYRSIKNLESELRINFGEELLYANIE